MLVFFLIVHIKDKVKHIYDYLYKELGQIRQSSRTMSYHFCKNLSKCSYPDFIAVCKCLYSSSSWGVSACIKVTGALTNSIWGNVLKEYVDDHVKENNEHQPCIEQHPH